MLRVADCSGGASGNDGAGGRGRWALGYFLSSVKTSEQGLEIALNTHLVKQIVVMRTGRKL